VRAILAQPAREAVSMPAMKRLALFFLLAFAAPVFAQPAPKVLAFYTLGGEIDHLMYAQEAAKVFAANAAKGGYSFAATTDWSAMNDTNLKDVKVVVFLNDQPHTPEARAAFQRYMEHGGGWMGFHISGFPSSSWQWYSDFLGVKQFGASNWPSLPARVNIDDGASPITRGLPQSFVSPINEWYSWSPSPRTNPDVHVLMTLDRSNFPLGIKNMLLAQDIPVAWTNTKYRMVYFNYGHGDQIYTKPELPRMTENGLNWLLGRVP
jgi:type 1 glutamine amidotransferase